LLLSKTRLPAQLSNSPPKASKLPQGLSQGAGLQYTLTKVTFTVRSFNAHAPIATIANKGIAAVLRRAITAPSKTPPPNMPSGYSSRDVGDPSQVKKNKQSMADLKLRRLTELNNRLREDLERERIPVSQAARRYVHIHIHIRICV
jgi:hypothetical protein